MPPIAAKPMFQARRLTGGVDGARRSEAGDSKRRAGTDETAAYVKRWRLTWATDDRSTVTMLPSITQLPDYAAIVGTSRVISARLGAHRELPIP